MAPQPPSLNRPPRFRNPPASASDPKAFTPSKPSPLGRQAESETGPAGAATKPKPTVRDGKGVSVSPLKSAVMNQAIRTHVDSGSRELVPRNVVPAMRAYDKSKAEHNRRMAAGEESPASLRRPDSPDSAISAKSTEPRTGKFAKPDTLSGDQSAPYQAKLNTSRSNLHGTIRGGRLQPRLLGPGAHQDLTSAEAPERLTQLKRVKDQAKMTLNRAEERVRTLEARVGEYEAKVGRSGKTSSKIKAALGMKKSAAELTNSLAGFRNELATARADRAKALQDFTQADGRYKTLNRNFLGGT